MPRLLIEFVGVRERGVDCGDTLVRLGVIGVMGGSHETGTRKDRFIDR